MGIIYRPLSCYVSRELWQNCMSQVLQLFFYFREKNKKKAKQTFQMYSYWYWESNKRIFEEGFWLREHIITEFEAEHSERYRICLWQSN